MPTEIDWSQTKFRASSWGNLMTEPVTKADKEAGKLSKTCQKELIKIYNLVKYGRKKDITTKQMDKGKLCENDSITLYSRVEKKLFYKNEEQLENDYFTGHPDIFTGDNILNAEECDDIKTSWELDSFMPKLIEEVDSDYKHQLNVYYDLTGAKCGHIVYCLVSAPESIILQEMKSLLWRMDVATELNPAYIEAAEELKHLMVFEDIPIHERIIKKKVERDDELIQKMKDKVPKLREWLADFEKKHVNQHQNLVVIE